MEEKLNHIIRLLEELSARVAAMEKNVPRPGERHPATVPSQESKPESLREFYLRHNPQKETDKTLVLISFLEKVRKISEVTTKEIGEAFKEAREPAPLNIADKVQLLDKRGFILQKGKKEGSKTWGISNSGDEFLEDMQNGK